MVGRMTRFGYEQVIGDDVRFVEEHTPECLTRSHVIDVLRASVAHEYPMDETGLAARLAVAEREIERLRATSRLLEPIQRRSSFIRGAIAALTEARKRVGDAPAGERAAGIVEGITLLEVCLSVGEDPGDQIDALEIARRDADTAHEIASFAWRELGAVAKRLGYERGDAEDFGETDLVEMRERVEDVATAAGMLPVLNDAAESVIGERDALAAKIESHGLAMLDALDGLQRARADEERGTVRVRHDTAHWLVRIAHGVGRWVESVDALEAAHSRLGRGEGVDLVGAAGASAEARDDLFALARSFAAHGDALPDVPGETPASPAPVPGLTPIVSYEVVDALDRGDGVVEFSGYRIAGRIGNALIVCASDPRDAERIVEALRAGVAHGTAGIGGYDSVIVVPEAVRFLRVRDDATNDLVKAARHAIGIDPDLDLLAAALAPFEVTT